MRDPLFKYSTVFFLLGSVLLLLLSFLGALPWPTTFFAILMAGISLGALAEYRNVL